MKKIAIISVLLVLSLGYATGAVKSKSVINGCYMCELPDTYVQFEGTDNKKLQKMAYEKYACTVYAVIDHCDINTAIDGPITIAGTVK